MKNLTEYLKLWQKKRNELRIDDDADKDWAGMGSLLDEHLPIDTSGEGKKRGISLFSIMMLTLGAAAMTYFTARVVEKKIQQYRHERHTVRHHNHGHNAADSTVYADSVQRPQDSLALAKEGVAADNKLQSNLPAGYKSLKKADLGLSRGARGLEPVADKNPQTTNAAGKNIGAARKEGESKSQHASSGNSSAINTHPVNSGQRVVGAINQLSDQEAKEVNNSPSNGAASFINVQQDQQSKALSLLEQPRQSFDVLTMPFTNYPVTPLSTPQIAPNTLSKDIKPKTVKPPKVRTESNSPLEWGLLIGANAPGSFTPKSQNANFYGRLPVDAFTGAYGTYNLNEKWGVGAQVHILSPAVISGNYKKPYYTTYSDTDNVLKYHVTADSRKIYSVQVPLYAVYKITNNVSFKAGPVFSIPVKQFSMAKIDSANSSILTQSHYDQKIDLGLSGGVSIRYKRLIFEATYLRGLTAHQATSDSLSYKAHNSQLQFTIGIQLGGKKK